MLKSNNKVNRLWDGANASIVALATRNIVNGEMLTYLE